MAPSDDLIDFNIIESHKENIQALPSGRSAKALAQLYSPPLLGANPSPKDANAAARAPFEQELANIDEADDPLDVYDRYVKWTLDAYPSTQATPQSQLLPLLERATKTFQSSTHYKNDPRYLRLWLHYIRLFSDAPREVFAFLSRHGIGESLALYYEEFAAWLENAGRWTQAEEVYHMGLEREARPAERLLRKFGEFERRKEARPLDATEPTSPALPVARKALAAKLDPFATSSPSTEDPQQSRSTAPKKSKSSKMAVFSDVAEPVRPDSGSSSKGWDNIGTLAERKKENAMEAKPWAGETLKGGKTNGGMQKMMIFKDDSMKAPSTSVLPKHIRRSMAGDMNGQQCIVNPKTGRKECVFVNLEEVYPRDGYHGAEYCFEELRARRRGWVRRNSPPHKSKSKPKTVPLAPADTSYDDSRSTDASKLSFSKPEGIEETPPELTTQPKQRGFKIFEDVPPKSSPLPQDEVQEAPEKEFQTLALNDENDENMAPSKADIDLAKRLRREERANRTRKIKVMDVKHIKNETQTIQLKLDSPQGPKLRRKKSSDRNVAEPTMTINTKEAMDEIYGMFSQPLPSQVDEQDEDEDDSDDDCTTGDESTATGKLSATASEYGDDTRNELLVSREPAIAEDGRTEVTGWSDITTSKHIPQQQDDSAPQSVQSTSWDVYQDSSAQDSRPGDADEVITPLSDEQMHTEYVLIAPEDYEPPRTQLRTTALPNHRLPFMTPIVEHTESSLGGNTSRSDKDYFNAKTPSRHTSVARPIPEDDEIYSSPFQEIIADMAEEKRKVLQPIRTKTTKGTISLGAGSAKSQIEKKAIGSAPAVELSMQKGPIVLEGQCNPMDPELRDTILSRMKPAMTSYEGYYEHLDVSSGRTAEIRKYIKTSAKSSRSTINPDKTSSTLALPPMLSFPEASDTTYTVKRELGAGTFAPVYLIQNSTAVQQAEEEDSKRVGKLTHRRPLEALKMESPPSTWEFHILQLSHRRLGLSRASQSIVRAHEMHLYRDECFLIEEFRDQGTLLDLVNLARVEGSGGVDECMAMWLTIELFRTIEALHAKQLIHGDLKGDNVLVRFDDPGQEVDWSPTYFASGAHGWASKGLCLIDFGRGIDMRQFVDGVQFVADWKTSEADCAEMREARPWTYQIDYHGLAGIVHSLLFGKYMETIGEKTEGGVGQGGKKTYKIRESLKRYWQGEIWSEVFSLLLNPLQHVEAEEDMKMPVLRGMRACRDKMEAWVEEHCEKGVGLKSTIGRMEVLIRDRRRKSGK